MKQDYQELHELAAQIAARLGEDWSYDPAKNQTEGSLHWSAIITHLDGYGLHISSNRDGRLTVRADWPMDAKKQAYFPYNSEGQAKPITISLTKSPMQIAKEISRRFLPRYVRAWLACKARAEAANCYVEAQKDHFTYLQEACPQLQKRTYSNEEGTGHIHKGSIYGDVTCYKDSVNLTLHGLSIEQAYQILKILG